MASLSVLDLVMIGEGKTFSDSLSEALTLARHIEKCGFKRFWVAEHHNIPGIASAATTLIMSHIAAGTRMLRIGSGGMMMPNHSPLIVAEQFATLAALYPDRIDLGVGRAPGGNALTTQAVRGDFSAQRELGDDITTLQDYLSDNGKQPVRSSPGKHNVPVWVLGSGMHGADLAARMGLPYAFASHFAPAHLMGAIDHYRNNFKPGPALRNPYVVAGVNVYAADSHEEAELLASSHRRWIINRNVGTGGPLPRPDVSWGRGVPNHLMQLMEQELACTAVGTRDEVGRWLRSFLARTGVDELMIDCRIYDPVARCHSCQLAAESLEGLLD